MEYAEDIERTIDTHEELEKFDAAIVSNQVKYEKPIGAYLLSKFLFRRELALRTALAGALQAMSQPRVIARFQELGVGDTRMNMDEFYYVMCDLMRDPHLSRHDSDRIFQAMDFNGSGIVDGEEITIGLNVLFRSQMGSIAVFAKKTLDARSATDDFISLSEVQTILTAIASLCHGRYHGAQDDVIAVMNKLAPLARDSAVPLEWVQEFIASDAPLISKVLSELPRDGSEPTPAALGRLPSPDPVRDVLGIHAAVESKKKSLTVTPQASGPSEGRNPTTAFSQEVLQNPRFHADLFVDSAQRKEDIPEHTTHEYYSINGVVWRRTDKGPEVVT